MFPTPSVMTHDAIPTGYLEMAGLRMASLVDAGEDIRPTRHQLVTFALAIIAGTVGSIRFDPTGLTPERQSPADYRFVSAANRTLARWHGVLPFASASLNGDGTVTVARTERPSANRDYHSVSSHRCWHAECAECAERQRERDERQKLWQ